MAENEWRWIGPDGFEYTGNLETLKAGLAAGRLPGSTMVSGAHLEGWLPAADVPELDAPRMEPAPVEPAPLPAFEIEDEALTVRDNPIPEPPPPPPPPEPPTARRPAVAAPPPAPVTKPLPVLLIAGLVGVAAFVLGGITVLLLVARRGDEAPLAVRAPAAPSVASPAPHARACVAQRAGLVSRPVFGKIPLEVAAVGKDRVAVAFASSPSEAKVVVLGAETLEKHQERRQPSKAPVAGARPLVRGDAVELVLDGEEPNLRGARSILGDKPLRIGAAHSGIARSAGDGEPEVVWPLAEKELTPMRVESDEATGHFVALRSGGQGGKVLAGWLAHDGSKKTELLSPELGVHAVGTPAPALGPTATLLLVAAKPSAASDWQLFAGKGPLGRVPAKLAPLALGDDSAVRISPAAFGLPSGGWLLQWTEGPDGAHVVKVQELGAELDPIGSALRVSPEGSDSGQGRVWSDGTRAVSFFLVSTGESHELWAAPFSCR